MAAGVLLLCWLPPHAVGQSVGTANVKNVVVVYSYDSVLPANVIVDRVLRENMQSVGDSRIEIYSEYLDIARFAEAEHLDRMLASLRSKYAGRKIDLLIAGGSDAFGFLSAHRDSLFPESDLIYTCVDSERIASDARFVDVPGVQIRVDLLPTLELARALQPEATELFVITGASQLDCDWERTAREQLSSSTGGQPLQIRYLSGLPVDAMLQRVGEVSAESIVLFLLCMQDGNGEHFLSPDVVQRVAEVSPAPVYGIYNTYHGKGIVGGHFATFESLAKATSELGLQILRGTDPTSEFLVSGEPTENHLDWRQMEHWGLDPSRVPAGTVIAFRELSAWEQYPGRIVGAFSLIVLQAGLIVLLLVQIQRRRIAERSQLASQDLARQQRDELARVNRVTTVGEMSASIAHEVNQPLAAIVSNAHAAMRLLQQVPPDTAEVAAALQDIAGDGNRAAGILNHVRSLARKEPHSRELIDLNTIVRVVLRLAAADIESRGIAIHQQLDDALPRIEGDEIGFQQLILNLLINAAQAMQDVAPGSRRMDLSTTHDAESVYLSVADSGVGLDDDQLAQVFHPFFTMRPGGIGMGLSISQSIVESHNGEIWVTRNADRGVTFRVRLPAVSGSIDR